MEPLVSCEWLKERLDQGSLPSDVILLDVSWSSTKDMEEEYNHSHIPGARYLNVLEAKHTELYPRNLPDPSLFQARVRDIGVNNESSLILYSNSDAAGYFISGRAWWTFKLFGHDKVSILDGGWKKWLSIGGTQTKDIPRPTPGNFTIRRNDAYIAVLENVEDIVRRHSKQICDSRPCQKYEDSPGHIKGAANLPLSQLLDNGLLKSVDQIKQEFESVDIDLSKPLVTYCASGMSSCSLMFAAMLCGNKDVAVYHGGFTEFSKTADKQLIDSPGPTDD